MKIKFLINMKRILVPTDFSGNAENALNYAINIANHFESEVHLIHTYEVPSSTGMLVSVKNYILDDAEQELAKLAKKYQPQLLHKTSLHTEAVEGYTIDRILRYANGFKADLIVMGTKGASGLKELFIGSNTTGVINRSEMPVLAVPAGFNFQQIKEITFALDTEILSTSDVIDPLITLAKIYGAHISVLHVDKVKEAAGIDAGADIYLSDLNHSYHLVSDEKINRGINRFVVKSNADLLCMVHRKRGFLGDLFHKSVTSKEAFDSPVPLLVLHDKR